MPGPLSEISIGICGFLKFAFLHCAANPIEIISKICYYLLMNYDEEILNLLAENARLSVSDIAAMTKKTPEQVAQIIKQMEDDGIILKYAAIINKEKLLNSKDKINVQIQIQVTPERGSGFDKIADRIYRFPQVKSVYLMSGGYDFMVTIEGNSLKEVGLFVSEKLSTIEGVRSTKTSFVLKTYKENDVIYVEDEVDRREGAMA